jgi:uncharacterized membrane protein
VTEAKESTALTMDAGRKADEGAISPPALPLGLHWPQPKRPASFIEEPASFLQQQAKVCAGGSLLVVTGVGALGFLYSQNMASLPDVCIMALFLGLSLALDISIVAMSESHGGKLAYEKLTVVVFVELVKLVVSSGLYWTNGHQGSDAVSKGDIKSLAASAVLYSLSNYLLFATLEHIDPMTFAVIRDTNIVFVAILWALAFATPLGATRWMAIGLICVASVLVQLPGMKNAVLDPMVGVALLLTFSNATATVCNEKALKRSAGLDINVQNMILYTMCSSFTFVVSLSLRGPGILYTFFDGWDNWVIWIVALQSFIGLVVSRFLKQLSSVLKSVLTPIRTLLFLFAAPVFTRGEYSVLGITAGLVAAAGTFLFLRQGPIIAKQQPFLEDPSKPRLVG